MDATLTFTFPLLETAPPALWWKSIGCSIQHPDKHHCDSAGCCSVIVGWFQMTSSELTKGHHAPSLYFPPEQTFNNRTKIKKP